MPELKITPLKSAQERGFCEQKQRLIDLYSVAVAHYSTAISDINITRGKTSKTEYERLRSKAENLREIAESARLALD
jgi:hypothetical protein